MFFLRPGRLGAALRPLCIPSLVFLFSTAVDARTRPQPTWPGRSSTPPVASLPRAYVRVLVENGAAVAGGVHRRDRSILADGRTPDAVSAGSVAHRIPDGDGAMRTG